MLEGRIRKRARVSIIQAATTCHERPWLDFISTPPLGRRASSKVDIREIHKLCGWRRVRRRRDCNLLRIKLMNINHRPPARFTSPPTPMHFVLVSYTRSNHDPFPSHPILPFVSRRPLSRRSRSPLFFFPSPFFLPLINSNRARWCQSPGSLFQLEEFMLSRHAPRPTNNHTISFVVARDDGLLRSLSATDQQFFPCLANQLVLNRFEVRINPTRNFLRCLNTKLYL